MAHHELFDDAVFQRMEGDDGQRATGFEDQERGVECLLEFFKFGVDENPNSLKCARCRVLTRLAGFDRASHELGQFGCACEGTPLLPASNNRLCNRCSKPFFAVITYHLRYLLGIGCGQPVGCTLAARGVHAHVQRAVMSKGETPLRGVNLRGTHTQIQQDPINAARRQLAHLGETGMADAKARVVNGGLGMRHRLRIFVVSRQAALGGQSRQNGPAVTAAAKGAIDIMAPAVVYQRVSCFPEQDGDVGCGADHRLSQKTK